MIIARAASILLFLFILGLPLSFFCLRERRLSPYLVLAPHCGLALLAIIAVNAYLLNVSVSKIVLPVIGLCLLNGIGIVLYLFKRVRNVKDTLTDSVSSIASRGRTFLIPSLLFGAVCLVYTFPFILKPDMVFYAYAGTDGYAYMNTAEYQMSHGVYDAPSIDVNHVYSGLVAPFTESHRVEKPGTMMVLAFFSGLLSRLPHEVFSPLMTSYVLLIYFSVFALARSLTFAPILAGLAAFLSTVSLPVLALSSNTYFSATITMSLLPIILVLAQEMLVNRKSGLLFVVMLTAYFLFSPPSILIPIAAISLYIGYSGLRYLRRGTKTTLVNGIILIGPFLIINLLAYKIWYYKLDTLYYTFAPSPGVPRMPMDHMYRQLSWNLFWHTLGVGPIMASSATKLDTSAYVVLGGILLIGGLYFVRSILWRDFSVLFFSYLSFWLVVLVGGLGGAFRSYEILSRVSQQFVPLHGLVYLSFVNNKDPMLWNSWLRCAGLILALLLVTLYPVKYFYDFEKEGLLDNPQRVNQYFKSSFRARQDISRIVGNSPVLVNSSIPTYTGLANVATLFSNIQLAVPPAFLKFFFLDKFPRPESYFCAPTVLASELYTDIQAKDDDEGILYQENGFRLSKNDLILFFNNDTFEIKHGFVAEFLKKRSYVQARKLNSDTIIHVCSAEARTAQFTFRYTVLTNERVFDLHVSPGPQSGRIVFGKEGTLTTPAFPLSKGVNQIELRPESAGEAVEILGISTTIER